MVGACVLVTLLCVFSTFRSCAGGTRPDKFYDYVGTRAGEAAAKAVPSGGTFLLLTRPVAPGGEGVFEIMIRSCSAELKKRGVNVIRQELEEVELDDMTSETSVSAKRFLEAVNAVTGDGSIALVVSFVGVPPARLGKGAPPVYVVAASEAECRSAFERKQIVGALAMKPWDALSGQAIATEPAARFEQTCTMVP